MPWPLKDDFRPGEPLSQVSSDWLNTVARILNYLSGDGVRIEKTPVPSPASPWLIYADTATGGGASLSDATPLDLASTGDHGTSSSGSRSDHKHPALPTITNQQEIDTSDGDEATNAATWTPNGYNIKVWFHRFARVGDAGLQKIIGLRHFKIFNGVTGGLIQVGAEEQYTMMSLYPENPGDCTDLGLAGEGGSDSVLTDTWTSGGSSGCDFFMITRIRLDNGSANSNLYAYARLMRITADGRIYSIGAETRITISPTSS
jgi:hypothetical protein